MAQCGESVCRLAGWRAGRQYWKRREGSGSRANSRVMQVLDGSGRHVGISLV
jgi:hypothetical protein